MMMPKMNRRLMLLAVAMAGSALVQGCSVGTGQFVPSTVAQPASRMDMLHYRQQTMPMHRATIAPARGGMFDHKYY